MSDALYTKLSSASVQENKSLVLSACSKGGYTLAQQVSIPDGKGKKMNMYLKGAIHIEDLDGIISLRNALNIAIEKIEGGKF